jgi:outer membrane biosynthesis protein TonB
MKQYDHSDLNEDEKKAKGIETETEAEERAKKPKPVKAKKLKAEKKAAKPAKSKKPKAEKIAKPKKPKAEKKTSERSYVRHEGTKEDPFTGQKAPKRGLEREQLNAKEKEVLTAVNRAKEVSLADLAERCMPSNISKAKRNSWTRNALRRLVREKFIKHAGRGMYKAVA